MAMAIEGGAATFVRRSFGQREIYLVHCPKADRFIPVVYDPSASRSRIVTVLPEESRQFGSMPRRPRRKRFRECEPEEGEDDPVPACELPNEACANNALADALEKALREAGLGPLLGQSSPSEG